MRDPWPHSRYSLCAAFCQIAHNPAHTKSNAPASINAVRYGTIPDASARCVAGIGEIECMGAPFHFDDILRGTVQRWPWLRPPKAEVRREETRLRYLTNA